MSQNRNFSSPVNIRPNNNGRPVNRRPNNNGRPAQQNNINGIQVHDIARARVQRLQQLGRTEKWNESIQRANRQQVLNNQPQNQQQQVAMFAAHNPPIFNPPNIPNMPWLDRYAAYMTTSTCCNLLIIALIMCLMVVFVCVICVVIFNTYYTISGSNINEKIMSIFGKVVSKTSRTSDGNFQDFQHN
jgi:hypothetical protein